MRAVEWEYAPLNDWQQHIAAVILDEIAGSSGDAFTLPMPADPRLLRIATALADAPADQRSLEDWANWAHAAPRTVSRLFVAETGLTFTAWRQRARLVRALELLAAGEPVASVAYQLGYDNVSAFIALFRRTFGTTLGRYFGAEPTALGSTLERPTARTKAAKAATHRYFGVLDATRFTQLNLLRMGFWNSSLRAQPNCVA